jgi:hypothetical protein
MERRLNKRAETYVTCFKDGIREKATQLGLSGDSHVNVLCAKIWKELKS